MAWSDYRALGFNYDYYLCYARLHCTKVLMGSSKVELKNFLGIGIFQIGKCFEKTYLYTFAKTHLFSP